MKFLFIHPLLLSKMREPILDEVRLREWRPSRIQSLEYHLRIGVFIYGDNNHLKQHSKNLEQGFAPFGRLFPITF